MWGLETIKALNGEFTEQNREAVPLMLDEHSEIGEDFPLPYMGTRCEEVDEEKERIETLFIDTSGWGREGEPALTKGQLAEELERLIGEHSVIYVAGEELGQFQGFVAVWI